MVLGPREARARFLEVTMFLMLSKGPRKTNRKKCARIKAKHKAKNRGRRNRIYQRSK
jgi:hypothetical protein